MTLPAKQLMWNGRTSISTFVHSLHLLDLDLLEDWPGISKETLSSRSNLQHRMRCVEWALYRLFELLDSRLTKEKLLPFFLPTTSLQSINLRAALFRQLNELKKDGRLGPNVVLRKSMLDECKGDKFEELLASFSIIVLKRTKKLSTESYNTSSTRAEHLLPLIISHRKGIEQDLVKRKDLKIKAQNHRNLLHASLTALTTEESDFKQRKAPKLPDNADTLRQVLCENWLVDADWVATIIDGELPDPLQEKGLASYQTVENYETEDDKASKLLDDLSCRVSAHDVRLARWQKCLKDLQQNQGPGRLSGKTKVGAKEATAARFTQHHDLGSMLISSDVKETTLGAQQIALFESFENELTRTVDDQAKRFASTEGRYDLSSAQASRERSDSETKLVAEAFNIDNVELSNGGLIYTRRHLSQSPECNAVEKFGTPVAEEQTRAPETPPPQSIQVGSSLLERTKASLAHLTIPEAQNSIAIASNPVVEDVDQATIGSSFQKQSHRSSLLERTRESILLTNAFEDAKSHRTSGARKSLHSKSKSVNIPSQNRRRERTWSEDSLASTTAKENLDINADYESVFKSRPKLAMSPNLSPQRNDLFDEFLEEGMKKLTIAPTL